MSDWQPLIDEGSGQTYYYNANTQESSWDMPVAYAEYEASLAASAGGNGDNTEEVDKFAISCISTFYAYDWLYNYPILNL